MNQKHLRCNVKKTILAAALAALTLLSACAAPIERAGGDKTLTVAAMTYPVYLFTLRVAEGVEGIAVENVVNQPMSCLHDYTMTVADMKTLQGADLLLLSGVGLEDAMSAAIGSAGLPVADCSAGVSLLHYDEDAGEHAAHGDDGHDHGEYDPHIWMDPDRAAVMVENIAGALSEADPANAEAYRVNADAYAGELNALAADLREKLSGLAHRDLITFHEGFGYFADSMGLRVVKAIEEEAGSEASAKELVEIVGLIHAHDIPSIFTEANGSEATAQAVARETGVGVYRLSMLMSADAAPEGAEDPYKAGLTANVETILEALGG